MRLSQTSGSKGIVRITVSADATFALNNATLQVSSGSVKKSISYHQQMAVPVVDEVGTFYIIPFPKITTQRLLVVDEYGQFYTL